MMGENELFHDESETDRYLTPIFGSEVSDAAMPSRELADGPVEPRIAYRGKRHAERRDVLPDLHGADGYQAHGGESAEERHR